MENVLIFSEELRAAKLVIILESIPPLKNIPKGTSDINLCFTDSSRSLRSCLDTSFSSEYILWADFLNVISQYEFITIFILLKIRIWPGNNFFICLNIEF